MQMILDDTDSSDEEVEPAPVGDLKDDRFKPILYFFVFLLHWKAAFNISAAAIGSILTLTPFAYTIRNFHRKLPFWS